ncbi:MAG: hypothetical protein IJG85_03820 [Eubacteriaceae bacterium]|nr:hypothetical protein [Eubacteriaceae bacterium]
MIEKQQENWSKQDKTAWMSERSKPDFEQVLKPTMGFKQNLNHRIYNKANIKATL